MKQIFDAKQSRLNDCGAGLVVLLTNEQAITATEHQQTGEDTYEDKEVEKWQYECTEVRGVKAPVTEDSVLAALKEQKIKEVEAYDQSAEVNEFDLNTGGKDYAVWFSAVERNKLTHSIGTWKAAGNDKYRLDLRDYGISVEADCDKLLAVLQDVENYAVQTYNTTSEHIREIQAAGDIETLAGYDVSKDYPNKVAAEL